MGRMGRKESYEEEGLTVVEFRWVAVAVLILMREGSYEER